MKNLLSLFMFCICVQASAQQNEPVIHLNQLGFYSSASKIAVVAGEITSDTFYVLNKDKTDAFFAGRLSAPRKSKNSSVTTRIADFSTFTKPGTYVLAINGATTSYPFEISDDVYDDVAKASLKAFYYQRSDMPLHEKHAGKWHRPAGHRDTEVYVHASAATGKRPEGTIISSPKGWYDAGDYNKYIVNSGITMGTLLSAYEDYPTYFDKLDINIPESGNKVPDILDEIIYNLRWMLTMQDPHDGGVYHKLTNANFDGMVMPGITKDKRYVVQKNTTATLDFAAVMAQAARVLKPYSKQLNGLPELCLAAAEKAWHWAQVNYEGVLYDQDAMNKKYDPDITTGGYGDRSFKDEAAWAAAELFVTTGKEDYIAAYFISKRDSVSLPGWSNVEMLAHYTLLRHQHTMEAAWAKQLDKVKQQIISLADTYVASMATNAFATVMGGSRRDFNWGSNSNAANQGILLLNAYRYTNNKKYFDAALSNLDYILGRNATGYSFVTGYGSKTPKHPHHRPSEADGIAEPVPGLLVGGPNPGMQDKCKYIFTEPETAYVDDVCSYASNEIAINWNAPLVYLANGIVALQR